MTLVRIGDSDFNLDMLISVKWEPSGPERHDLGLPVVGARLVLGFAEGNAICADIDDPELAMAVWKYCAARRLTA